MRAVEESDGGGRLLPAAARRRAGVAAKETTREGDEGGWLAARARALTKELETTLPAVPRVLRLTRLGRQLLGPTVLLALIVGLLTNAVGPTREIHVLALPLVGILAWNVVVLLLYATQWLVPKSRRRPPRLLAALEGVVRRLVTRLPRSAMTPALASSSASTRAALPADAAGGEAADAAPKDDADARRELARRALGGYLAGWFPTVTPLAAARLRRALHAGSVALVAGILGGMYLRGILFRYRATWESTFLEPPSGQALLDALLGPASWLTGIAVPSVAAIAETPGDAAPWLHLWAATTAIFVVVPRLALLAVDALRAAHRARRLPVALPARYLRRLRLAIDDTRRSIEVLAYSYRPSPRALQTLKGLLYDVFGPRAEIRVEELSYGDEPAAAGGGARARVLLASLAQTPETEVHGALAADLRRAADDGEALVVALDAGAYRQRLGADAGERVTARRKAWERVLADAGVPYLHLDLEAPLPEDAVPRFLAAAWPAGVLDDVGEAG